MSYRSWSSRRSARRRNQQIEQIRRASIVVLRGYSGTARRVSWIQDVNHTFARLYRQDHHSTFADALRAYADTLDGGVDNEVQTDNDLVTNGA